MRWKKQELEEARIKTKFLLFPKEINGEVRWLEIATWSQTLENSWDGLYWKDVEWIKDDQHPSRKGMK